MRLTTSSISGRAPLRAVLAATAAGLLLAGCGAGDVELNGKIFDAMGVSNATKVKSEDANLKPRQGLVVPPTTASLPEPGTGRSVEAEADLAFINDPDRKKTLDQAELARRQAEYCKVHYELPKARGDQSVDSVVGPAGPCRTTFMSAMKKWNGEDKDGE